MRQRILVIAAFILACYLAVSLVIRFGKGSDALALQSVKGLSYSYAYRKITRTDRLREPRSSVTSETSSQFVFKERKSKGSRPFSSVIGVDSYSVSVDGKPLSNPPRTIQSNTQLDRRGRMVINDNTGLYPLDLLNAPEFFPILSGEESKPGDEWEDQFRVIPPYGDPIIVVTKTRFISRVFEDAQLLSLLEYKATGESYFPDPSTGEPRKGVLSLSGSCKWNAGLGVPHSIQQNLEFRVMDYSLIRKGGDLLRDETLATVTVISTTMNLQLQSKAQEKEKTPPPTASPQGY